MYRYLIEMLSLYQSGRVGEGGEKFNFLRKKSMKTNEMTPEQSLQLISDAITKSRKDFERNSGTPLVLWGCVVLVFSLLVWSVLEITANPLWNFLWFAIPIVGFPLSHFCVKHKVEQKGKNFINETIGMIWIGYGILATVLALILVFLIPEYVGAIHIAMLGYGAFMTGAILKNPYIAVGGLVTGIGGAVAMSLLHTYDYALVFAVASVVSMILPGVMMNRKANKK